jgi:hypothetical protein
MTDPRAFVSFDFDHDEESRRLFVGQGKRDSPTPFTVGDWSSKEVLPQKTWEQTIETKIGRCHLLIVLVGRQTYSAAGVKKEIAMAGRKDVPVFGVYVDGAGTSTTLPAGLPRNRTVAWRWSLVAAAINQTLGEGKNALAARRS